jgi:hypothetical protein
MKLTYEEWKVHHSARITNELLDALENFLAINAEKEIEKVMHLEYEFYANGGFDTK